MLEIVLNPKILGPPKSGALGLILFSSGKSTPVTYSHAV